MSPGILRTAPALLRSPTALLLATGFLIGLNFPLGKLGAAHGVPPLGWALLISASAALCLLPPLMLRRRLRWPDARLARYTVVSALISFVAPNLMLFSVIPHVGAGYSGLMFALSPVCTVLLAGIFRLKTPAALGKLGIALGLAGAAVVSLTRVNDVGAPDPGWLALALAIPLTLASGNVYRTLAWPADANPDVLAFWGHAFSSAVFIGLLLTLHGELPWTQWQAAGPVAVAQAVVAALTFPFFFRLQQVGGPVLLSQIGYVAAAVGLLAATLFLGETYPGSTWFGAAIVGIGIALTIRSQQREQTEQRSESIRAATTTPTEGAASHAAPLTSRPQAGEQPSAARRNMRDPHLSPRPELPQGDTP